MKVLIALALVYLTYAVLMVVLHPRFIYPFFSEGGVLPGFQEVQLSASDGTPLFVQEHVGPGPVLVYFMGNAGALPFFASAFDRHIAAGRHVIAMEYRGGGGRPGTAREDVLKRDALVVMDHAASFGKPVVVQGYSMGSGLATYVAARREVVGMILVAPFDRMCRIMAAGAYLPACWMPFVDHWRSIDQMADVEAPVIVLHGTKDAVIPASYSAAFESLPNVSRHLIEGAGHNDIGGFPDFGAKIEAFINALPDA